jgi:exodeoxyribonuclease VII large subunit
MQLMTVSAFLAYVNETFKAIWDPAMVAVEGEVSGFRISQGQWVNFDLKDEEALVPVFMVVRNLRVPLQDGMRVRLYGFPRVYPKYGKFSFSADRLELVGEGALRKALALLREKLLAEGLFDPSRKRKLPRFPQRIALVASRESAAYGDFLRIVHERWGGLQIDLYHVLVQGEMAPASLVSALQTVNEKHAAEPYDVVVVTRGGGSFEELMAFNDERVVRALHASRVPTLVGIGHERDLSLAEEAADVRGSTPTDCARRLVPDRREVLFELATMQGAALDALEGWMTHAHEGIDAAWRGATHWLERWRLRTHGVAERALAGGDRWHERLQERAASLERVLHSYDPRAVLQRGYAIVRADGSIRTDASSVTVGQALDIELHDGHLSAVVGSSNRQPKLL